ncbi:MAG TPA: hypothetical protein DCG34_12370, partial [Clostridiales bacterium]|nr:hypothetical protein [Clostridiales bacterium]
MNWLKMICAVFVIYFCVSIGSAETFDIKPIENSYIDSLNPLDNYGKEQYLKTWSASNRQQRPYLKFYVPEHTDSAIINVFLQNYGGSSFKIYRTTTDWNELDVTYSTGRPILESTNFLDDAPNKGSGVWYSFDVSSVVNEPGYYSFFIATQWGYKNEFNSTRASANQPYMRITTKGSQSDISTNSKTRDSSNSFLINENEKITFSIDAPDILENTQFNWYVNKKKQIEKSKDFEFIVPSCDISQPSSCIWEIRVEGMYANNSPIIREWLISSLEKEHAPDFIDYFIDRDNRWRTGYVSDPWGRQFPSYDQSLNLISKGYYSGSETSNGILLSSKFNITDGTFKFKIRNPGALTISYFKVEGEPEPRYNDGSLMAPSWRYELTSSEFHDYFAILNYRIGFGDKDGRYSWGSYIPISRRGLGQAPGFHWWKGAEWRDITIIKTHDGWWSIWENGVLIPHSYANFEDAFNNATKLTLAANGILEMDCIEVYKDRYIYPKAHIYYGDYPKWWRLVDTTNNRFDPVDIDGIIVSGRPISLKQIADVIDNSSLITYDATTRTAVLKTNLIFTAGSEFIMDDETLVIDTSSGPYSIDIKPGVVFKVFDSKITATDSPLIWNIASSVSMEVFDPIITRNESATTATARNNGIYDFRGSFIVEGSVIDNTCNLFLDAPYEVSMKDVIFSNHSSNDHGDYTLRGAYENHNQKIRQSYGEKGLWIAPRIDLVACSISNVSFVDPKSNIEFKVIGGEWIHNATTVYDSDLSQIDIVAMKALKHEYFVAYREKNEKAFLALLNTLFDEDRLNIAPHSRLGGTYEYDEAAILAKYYLDLSFEDNSGNKVHGGIVSISSSNLLFPAENLYEYRDFITDAYGTGKGGATNYGPNSPQNDTYNGGVHTRWYNALPLGTAVTDSNGRTALPRSDDPKNSIVLIDYVLTSDAGTLKKESLTYTLNANDPSGQSVSLTGISPDPTWYREDPNIPTYTITAIIPDSSTSGPNTIGFAPSEDNPFVSGNSKKFRVWTDVALTSMKWYVDGVQVSSGSLEYDWSILEGSHTIHFEGADTNGAVMQSWSVTGVVQVPEEPKVPESSGGSGTSYTPSATSFTSSIGDSTNFIVDTDEQFTSTQWYFNGAA